MHISKKASFIATVCYGDIFDFPLTTEEMFLWRLFYPGAPTGAPRGFEKDKGFVYLKGRKNIIARRQEKFRWQTQKYMIADRAARWLSLIPTITLVGVTGGLAMNNAGRADDIDLFCVVSAETLWVSRFLATMIMELTGLRRHPNQRQVANKICLNMFMSDDALQIPEGEQDCFSAHEVLQMKPLWEQRGTYRKFLAENRWVRAYLPNAWRWRQTEVVVSAFCSLPVVVWFLKVFEFPSRMAQLAYMKHHRTDEVVTDTLIRFHPHDARVWIKEKLAARLRRYTIPLDKIFYGD